MPLVMPVAVAVAVRDVFPVCVEVPAIFVHVPLAVLKHTSYDAIPLGVSEPTFHDADNEVVDPDHVASEPKEVDRSKIFADVGLVGKVVSMVNPLEHTHPDVLPALSVARTHVKYCVPLVMPVAVAVAVREVLPVWVVVPAIFVHAPLAVLKHTSYDAIPLGVSDPTFHEAESAVVELDHVASEPKEVDRSKIFALVGADGTLVSIVKPLEHVHADVLPALSMARTHV